MELVLIVQGVLDVLMAGYVIYLHVRARKLWSWRKKTRSPYRSQRINPWTRLRLRYKIWRASFL